MIEDNIKFLDNEKVEKIVKVDSLKDIDMTSGLEILKYDNMSDKGFLYVTNKRLIIVRSDDEQKNVFVSYRNLGELEEIIFTDKNIEMVDMDSMRYKLSMSSFDKFAYGYCIVTLIVFLMRGNLEGGFLGMAAIAVGFMLYLAYNFGKEINSYNGNIISSEGSAQRFRMVNYDKEIRSFLSNLK